MAAEQVLGTKCLLRMAAALGCEGLCALSDLLNKRIRHLLRGCTLALQAGELLVSLLLWQLGCSLKPVDAVAYQSCGFVQDSYAHAATASCCALCAL